LQLLPKLFHIDLPDALTDEVEQAKNNEDVKKIGIEWCIQQCKELIDAKVPVLHFYTMGKSDATKLICSKIF
jgi:methylenetetrahydrofolate reductase (NADPH)